MYVPSQKQRLETQRLMSEDGLICQPVSALLSCPKVALFVDSVNILKSTRRTYGELARPDYRRIRELSASFGVVVRSEFFINTGFAGSTARIAAMGYTIVRSTDHDLDYLMMTRAVEAISQGFSALVLATGDHRFSAIAKICARLRLPCAAISLRGSVSNRLLAATTSFLEIPLAA